jgi:hypothetical protein
MAVPPRRLKFLTVIWALLIGAGLITLAGSIMLPSTKRARVDWDELRRRQQLADEAEAQARTQPTSVPTPAPTSVPATEPTPAPASE